MSATGASICYAEIDLTMQTTSAVVVEAAWARLAQPAPVAPG